MNKRQKGAQAIGTALGKVTARSFGRRGFAEGAVIRDWPEIVGPLLAAGTLPERIAYPRGQRAGGLLHLRVASAAVATEVQHLEPLIIDKINGYFGYGAVAGLRLIQRPLPPRATARQKGPRGLSPEERAALDGELADVTDSALREALTGLGRAVRGRRPETTAKARK